jgi:hypothetical protein
MTVKECIQGNAKFLYYRKGELYYETANGLKFPVPVSDCGDGEFKAEEKGMLMMRWIRKQLAAIEEGKKQ